MFTTLFGILSPAAKFVGTMIGLFGLVQLGLNLKDGGVGGGGQLGGAITMIVAGACIFACASMVKLPS